MDGGQANDLSRAGAGETAALIAAGKLSAVEAATAAIARIEALDGPINAVVVRDFERAIEAAHAADARIASGDRSPLLGVPMTVKDSHNVAGLPTTWGLEHAKGHIAAEDSVAVTRLKQAGAVILGKTNIPPSLGDWQSANPIYGRTNNPRDLTRSPGGSSGGGAAAVASGMVPLEFGSDIGGSIRVPASFCGVIGHKPTWELIPSRGHTPPFTPTTGSAVPLGVIGPLARSVDDLELALSVLAGPEEMEARGYTLTLPPPRHARLGDYRVLVLDSHPLAPTSSDIKAAVGDLAERLAGEGAQVSRASDRLPDFAAQQQVYLAILGGVMSRGARNSPGSAPNDVPSAHDWMTLIDAQMAYRLAWANLFREIDVVIAPNFGAVAFPHNLEGSMGTRTLTIDGQPTPYGAQIGWPGVATLPHLPATSVPIATDPSGLPIGVQVIGAHLEDRTTLAVARMIAAA
ncbi:MAG: amidase family protein [Caulobacteraceae bacterium]